MKAMQFAFTLKDRDYIFRKYSGQTIETAEEKAIHQKLMEQKGLFQLQSLGISKTNAFQYTPLNKLQINQLVVDSYNKYEVPVDAFDNFCNYVPLNEQGELEFVDFDETVRRAQGEKLDVTLWEHKHLQPSQLGKELADFTIMRVILLVLALLFIFPQLTALEAPFDESQEYGLKRLHVLSLNLETAPDHSQDYAAQMLQDEIDVYRELKPECLEIFLAESELAVELDIPNLESCVEVASDTRDINLVKVECRGCTVAEIRCELDETNVDTCTSRAYFDNFEFVYWDHVYNIIQTLCVIVFLMIGAYKFTSDAENLVITPIERMVKRVQELARNPVAQISADSDADMNKDLPFEIQLIEETLTKVTNLVHVGFGKAGAEIVGDNYVEGTFKVMVPGKKMFGIFSSCRIDKFVDITHCLQEDVLLFVNEIGNFIHSNVNSMGGFASKCDGESFLLVWKISSNMKEVPFIEATPAPEHLKSKEQVVDYFQNMVANEMENNATDSNEEAKNDELCLADSALLSALAVLSQLRNSTTQVAYRDNRKLMRRFEYPFITILMFTLHAGWAIQGSVGSQFKIDPGYVSPSIRVASKMQEANALYGTSIIMSHLFQKILSKPVQDLCRLVDCVHFGFDEKPHSLYCFDVAKGIKDFGHSFSSVTPLDFIKRIGQVQPPGHPEFVAAFNKGVNSYFHGDWRAAKDEIEKSSSMIPFGEKDGVGVKLLQYMKQADFQSPSDWTGYRTF